jgi:hypothetical protein
MKDGAHFSRNLQVYGDELTAIENKLATMPIDHARAVCPSHQLHANT